MKFYLFHFFDVAPLWDVPLFPSNLIDALSLFVLLYFRLINLILQTKDIMWIVIIFVTLFINIYCYLLYLKTPFSLYAILPIMMVCELEQQR